MQRLRTRAQFQAVLAGEMVSRTAHFALHRVALMPGAPPPIHIASGPESDRPQALFAVGCCWIGAMVPKRWARRAVTRNSIKRQIYAVSTEARPGFPLAAYVVRLRAAFDRTKFPSADSKALRRAVRAELQLLFAAVPAPDGRPQ